MPGTRVLVVGTTNDYIDYLEGALPGQLLFLTDAEEYRPVTEGQKRPQQLSCPLSDHGRVFDELEMFLLDTGTSLAGIACFDCESLILASSLARRYKLPFPSIQAVFNSRDKYRSKVLLAREGIPCPRAVKAETREQAAAFFDVLQGPMILKPATLSGSESIYRCSTRQEVLDSHDLVSAKLKSLLDRPGADRDGMLEDSVLCEEYIEGEEYSCDFMKAGGPPSMIRIARKYLSGDGPAGTAEAYEIPAGDLPVPEKVLERILAQAVKTLGIERCIGMADFIIRDSMPYFLEITPRPGGDCIPSMIRACSGFDILAANIGFSAGRPVDIPGPGDWRRLVGVLVRADRSGLLGSIRLDRKGLRQEIVEESWIRRPGDRVALPPDGRESWLLGHIIFKPLEDEQVPVQIGQIRSALEIMIEEESLV